MVPVVQLVRASDCGSECRGFESHRAPQGEVITSPFFVISNLTQQYFNKEAGWTKSKKVKF